MPKPTHDLHLDFETYCDLDLKKVGVHRYVAHPSFRVLCVAWKLDGQPTLSIVHLRQPQRLPPDSDAGAAEPRRAGPRLERRVRDGGAGSTGGVRRQPAFLHHAAGLGLRAARASWKRRRRRWGWLHRKTWRGTG